MSSETGYHEFYDRADQLARDGRYEEAIALYLKLSEMNPGDDSLIMSMAWAYRDSGNLAGAIECLETLLEKELSRDVFTGFAYDELVRILRETGNLQKLIDLCEKAVSVQPDDCALLATLGESCLKGGKIKRAIEVFELLTRMEPDSLIYRVNLGNALIADDEFPEAEKVYAEALALDPEDSASIYFRMADAYLDKGKFVKAEEALKLSIAADSGKPLYLCSLGDVYLKQGKIDEARKSYGRAAAIDPSSRAVYCNRLGNMLVQEVYITEAVTAFEEAIEADPKNPFYYLALLRACEKGGFDEKAREVSERALKRKIFA